MANGLLRMSDVMPLRQAIDRLFEEALAPFPFWSEARAVNRVPVDIYEDADRYVVRALLPGVAPDQLELTCRDNHLVLAGAVKIAPPDGMKAIVSEIGELNFRRELSLPTAVDADRAEASYEHGVLTLTLPKVAAAVAKKIPVRTAEPAAV